jgi:hypothetical protein
MIRRYESPRWRVTPSAQTRPRGCSIRRPNWWDRRSPPWLRPGATSNTVRWGGACSSIELNRCGLIDVRMPQIANQFCSAAKCRDVPSATDSGLSDHFRSTSRNGNSQTTGGSQGAKSELTREATLVAFGSKSRVQILCRPAKVRTAAADDPERAASVVLAGCVACDGAA